MARRRKVVCYGSAAVAKYGVALVWLSDANVPIVIALRFFDVESTFKTPAAVALGRVAL